jgi:PKHD-type hydroxylase
MTTTAWRCPNTEAPVYVVHNSISQEYADHLIKTFADKTTVASHQQRLEDENGNPTAEMTTNKEIRRSDVCFFNDAELNQINGNQMILANWHMGLRWKIRGAEQFQFTSYKDSEKGHYNWHTDGTQDHPSGRVPVFELAPNITFTNDASLAGTVRKISCSIILNDDYEGGELGFRWFENEEEAKIKYIKPKALDCIFFPSCLSHKVAPVTKGTRYSVVRWYAGPPLV